MLEAPGGWNFGVGRVTALKFQGLLLVSVTSGAGEMQGIPLRLEVIKEGA